MTAVFHLIFGLILYTVAMKAKYVAFILGGLALFLLAYFIVWSPLSPPTDVYDSERGRFLDLEEGLEEDQTASSANATDKEKKDRETAEEGSFKDSFDEPGRLYESGSPYESANDNWWLSSGGVFHSEDGLGRTNRGDMGILNPWYWVYFRSNPLDTDKGFHPQNIFRLVETRTWENATQTIYFRIDETNESGSPNRNASNGVLLFSRYQSSDDLYYAGLRVDGQAVIKKKQNGTYHTLGSAPVVPEETYDRDQNPNLLPVDTWIGMRSEVVTRDSRVELKLSIDIGRTGAWTEVLRVEDSNEPITEPGFAGIRTDFMDVSFDEYSVES